MRKTSLLSVFVSVLAVNFSCTKKDSAIRTVDNFGKTDGITTNSCGIALDDSRMSKFREYFKPIEKRIVTENSKLRDVTMSVLAVAPKAIRISFFAIPGTTIELVDDVKKHCVDQDKQNSADKVIQVSPIQKRFLQQMQKSGTISTLPGCWQTRATKKPRIVIGADEVIIRHHLLRIMAFVYTELLRKKVSEAMPSWLPKAPRKVEGFFESMQTKQAYQRVQLANAFFNDLSQGQADKHFKSATFLQTYETICKDKGLSSNHIKTRSGNGSLTEEDAKALEEFKKQSDKDKNGEFDDYLFAEVVDSYFCSPETYIKFANQFRLTYCAAIDTQIIQDLTRVGTADEFSGFNSAPKKNKKQPSK